jgi:hypothetical protein
MTPAAFPFNDRNDAIGPHRPLNAADRQSPLLSRGEVRRDDGWRWSPLAGGVERAMEIEPPESKRVVDLHQSNQLLASAPLWRG